jgi:hypothetical protein
LDSKLEDSASNDTKFITYYWKPAKCLWLIRDGYCHCADCVLLWGAGNRWLLSVCITFGLCGQKLPDSRFVFAQQYIETVPWGFVYDQFRRNCLDVIPIRSPVLFIPFFLAATVNTRLPPWTQNCCRHCSRRIK